MMGFMPKQFVCQFCGASFFGRHSNPNLYCSHSCSGRGRAAHRPCPMCGERCPVKRRYCSLPCARDAQRKALRRADDRICATCGVVFYRPPSNPSRNCSLACKGKSQQKYSSPRAAARAGQARYRKTEKGRLTCRIWNGEQSLRELEAKYVELVGGSHG